VATSGLSAQSGMHSAASVNAVTKSGTNRYSGNAFEFLRDKRFNAKSPFAAVGPDGKRQDDGLKRNQLRRHDRRSRSPGQAVLLCRLPGHAGRGRFRPTTSRSFHGSDAGRRLHHVRVASLPGPASHAWRRFRQQSHRPRALQSRRGESCEEAAADDRSVRPGHLLAA
jgi:hypothetical protein